MNCCSKLTWQPWNNDVKYALCVSNMPNAVPSFEQLPASSKPPLWNPNNFSFLSTPCVWHTHTLSSRSKFKFWMLITFSIPYQKNDTKWPKMKKTLFSFDRLTEKINAKPTLYSETSSWFITDILQNRKCVISFCPNLSQVEFRRICLSWRTTFNSQTMSAFDPNHPLWRLMSALAWFAN